MGDATTTVATDALGSGVAAWRLGAILRDIARGGIAGLVVGIVVGGTGARLAMRLVALVLPGTSGSLTENGNRIGDITIGGTLSLVIFAGLFVGIFVGVIWVVASPWLPRGVGSRALAAIPLAIGLGAFGLIQGDNPDFSVLGHDPRVIAILLGFVGLVGASMAVFDAWLDHRLPPASSPTSTASLVYTTISIIGAVFAIGVGATFLGGPQLPAGVALVATGLATLGWWFLRYQGADQPPRWLRLAGSGSLTLAVVLAFLAELPDIRAALGDF
jgi:hypothetical protein